MTTRTRRSEADRPVTRSGPERRPSAALLTASSTLFGLALLVSLLTLFAR